MRRSGGLRTDTPFLTAILGLGVVVGAPIVVFVLFTDWADSGQRQIAGVLGLFGIGALAMFRQKYPALMLTLLAISQFRISLLTIPLTQPAALQIVLTDVVLLLFVIAGVERRQSMRPDAIGWALIALIVWSGLVTLVASAHVAKSLTFILWLLKCLALYLLVLNMTITEQLAKRVVIAVLLALGMQAGLAIAQKWTGGSLGLAVFGEPTDPSQLYYVLGGLRMTGTLGATNAFAGYISMLLVFLVPFVFRKQSLIWYACFGAGVVVLVLALSRAGWLSFVLGSGLAVFAMLRVGLIRFSRMVAVTLLATMLVGTAATAYFDRIQDRFQNEGAIRSAEGRLDQFAAYWPTVKRHAVFGIGPGVTEFYGAWNDNSRFVRGKLPGVDLGNQPHNSLLQFWIEIGTLGFLLLALILALVVKTALRRPTVNPESPSVSLMRIGAGAAAFTSMVHASFGTEINNIQIGIVFWTLLAIARNRQVLTHQSIPSRVMLRSGEYFSASPQWRPRG